jgi:Fic family protein
MAARISSMANYIWQQANWPHFTWDESMLLPVISEARLKQGQLIQKIQSLLESDAKQAEAKILEEETLKTALIEGEKYDPRSVRSSINRRLGLDFAGLPKTQRHIDGLVEVLFDATLNFNQPLSKQRILSWHAALFPTSFSGMTKIRAGKWRDDSHGPMQVVSGSIGKEMVHYQAPPARRLNQEITAFIKWWKTNDAVDGIIRAGIAHLYFITIHPFEDGNGRIARVLTDMALAQDDKLAKRYYSLSSVILKQRKEYYRILEQTQKEDLNITNWLVWFVGSFDQSLDESQYLLSNIFTKAEYWRRFQAVDISPRQRKVVNVLLDAGRGNFEGGLTTRKYVSLAKVSRATAGREIQDLLEKDLIVKNKAAGRSVSYDLNW